jgi:hypothetical protein
MKESKEQYFVKMCYFCQGILGFDKPVLIKKDNREYSIASVPVDKRKKVIHYNEYKLNELNKSEITLAALHELGHLIKKFQYETEKEQILSERFAERFALKCLKKYFIKDYKYYCQHIAPHVLKRYFKIDKLYYEAFKPIKEYKEFL